MIVQIRMYSSLPLHTCHRFLKQRSEDSGCSFHCIVLIPSAASLIVRQITADTIGLEKFVCARTGKRRADDTRLTYLHMSVERAAIESSAYARSHILNYIGHSATIEACCEKKAQLNLIFILSVCQ